jgi:hypothetical protein
LGKEESTLCEKLTEVHQGGCGLDLDEAKADIVVSKLLVAEVLAAEATHERGELLVLLHLLANALDLLGHSSEPLRHPQASKQAKHISKVTATVKGEKEQRWSGLNLRCWRDHYGSWAWGERRRRWTASAPWRRRGRGGAAVLGGVGDRGAPGGARRGRSRRSARDAAPPPRPPCSAAQMKGPEDLAAAGTRRRVSRGL